MPAINTTITAITVYTDRARVTRRGTATIEPGLQQLEIHELPLTLNPDSARASARGPAQARLLGLQVQRVFFSETPGERLQQLEAEIEAIQDEKRDLEAQAKLAKQIRANVAAVMGRSSTYAVALVSKEMSLEDQLALFEQLGARAGALDREVLSLAVRQRALDRRLEKVKKDLDRWRGSPRREAYTAILEVEAQSPGEWEIELVYLVSEARWEPLYDLRLQEETGEASLEVSYLGQVTQHSGEDWSDVALTLSTARPSLAGNIPELDPWYVRPLPPPRPLPARAPVAAKRVDHILMSEVRAPAAEMAYEAAEPVMAEVDSSGASVTYQVPGVVTIPSDGTPHKATIARYPLEPRLDYVSAPKIVEAVYRRAQADNHSPYTLLPGPANLFAGEEFIGATRLDLIAPQGEIELFLGVDDRLKVKRELKRRDVDKKILGGRRRLHYGYEITLENLLPWPAQVTLHDQMPVSTHEEVKVRLDAANPPPSEQSELNLLDWKFTLAPQEKRTVRFDFTIESPQDMELVGIP